MIRIQQGGLYNDDNDGAVVGPQGEIFIYAITVF